MPRLQRGEDPHIDHINDLVYQVKNPNNKQEFNDGFNELLNIFTPLLYSVCDKWANYFNDKSHSIIKFNDLLADAQYWFMRYTLDKYTIDGVATFNTFIKNHIDQRVRFIYEQELNYRKRHIFPDPDRDKDDRDDPFEQVVYGYSSGNHALIDDDLINNDIKEIRHRLAERVLELCQSGYLNDREKIVLKEIMYNGITQEEMARRLKISRTRIGQVFKKAQEKLYWLMNRDQQVWDLVVKADIDFEEQ